MSQSVQRTPGVARASLSLLLALIIAAPFTATPFSASSAFAQDDEYNDEGEEEDYDNADEYEEDEEYDEPPRRRRRRGSRRGGDDRGYTPPYGMAGCGLGSMIISENEKLPQLGVWWIEWGAQFAINTLTSIAAISTGATAPGTGFIVSKSWSISTGTSNCTDRPRAVALEQEVFVEANWAALSADAAMGEGPVIHAWAELLGCDEEEPRTRLYALSQKHHSELFSGGSQETISEYLRLIRSNESLAAQCLRV